VPRAWFSNSATPCSRPARWLDLKELIDLVAVATISDIVPMVGENRLMVRHGLRHLPNTLNPGLRALQDVTGMNGSATSMDVGFRIGPRLNAPGAWTCRRTRWPRSRPTAAGWPANSRKTRRLQQGAAEPRVADPREAVEMLNRDFDPARDPVIVLGSRSWHHGVVGIVASRLMRQYHKPTFIIAIDGDGIGKGSGRSIEGSRWSRRSAPARADLLAGGGHAMAAGLSIEESNIDRFPEKLRRLCAQAHHRGAAPAEADV
jgi:single-stranded-DNA-specific exonuclease